MATGRSLRDTLWSLDQGDAPLSVFQRVLLLTDGTVTDVLEAYLGEGIRIVKLAQSLSLNSSAEAGSPEGLEMNLIENDQVLHRTVLLQGSISGINFIHGDSVIIPDRLPASVLEGLLTTTEPIGRLLVENRVETFREIVGFRFGAATDYAHYFDIETTSPVVSRTYQIYMTHRPVMRITESFPLTWFGGGMT